MLHPHGQLQIFDPSGSTFTADTVTCGHCQSIVQTKPGTAATVYVIRHRDGRVTEESGAFCRVCMRSVCLRCHGIGTCTPYEKWLEQLEQLEQIERHPRLL